MLSFLYLQVEEDAVSTVRIFWTCSMAHRYAHRHELTALVETSCWATIYDCKQAKGFNNSGGRVEQLTAHRSASGTSSAAVAASASSTASSRHRPPARTHCQFQDSKRSCIRIAICLQDAWRSLTRLIQTQRSCTRQERLPSRLSSMLQELQEQVRKFSKVALQHPELELRAGGKKQRTEKAVGSRMTPRTASKPLRRLAFCVLPSSAVT